VPAILQEVLKKRVFSSIVFNRVVCLQQCRPYLEMCVYSSVGDITTGASVVLQGILEQGIRSSAGITSSVSTVLQAIRVVCLHFYRN
jgi:hypothetical protein